MTSALPDTPGSSPGRHQTGPRERNAFNLNGHESGDDASPRSAQGFDRPDQTVFDLTMDYSDEETLLDWEQYAGMRKFKCWGMDCSIVARFCPFMPWVPPEWYYRYSRRQRRLMKMGFGIFGALLLLLIAATVLVSLLPNRDTPSGLGYANDECTWNSYHLPRSFQPVQYDLELDVQLQEPFLVTGSVHILANMTKPSRCIVLHALDMNISHMNLQNPHTHGTWKFNDQEQVILQFEDTISQKQPLEIVLHFNYTLNDGLSGFYRSNYTVPSGESRIMGTTQMEANSARRAFPCFDEPHLKAKWNFSMTTSRGPKVLFNTPETSSTPVDGGKIRHSFELTPPMSSYLVAFIVGDLTSVSDTVPYPGGAGADRLLSVWGTPERAESLQTALQIVVKVLPAYESIFGVPYPLPKLDLVAIPDFAAGAMENWGLITYRESALLFNANDSSVANERRIALIIAHEMAHMWFGDLVTMKDWGELWLNEGFATYFENVGASIARPSFAYFDTFFSDFGASAMAADALPKSTHPLAVTSGMDTAERVGAMFDDISYDKGGSVLRMLRSYLNRDEDPQPLLRRSLLQAPISGPQEAFLRGLQKYLQKYSYSSTSSNDLWAELDAVTGADVTAWMRSWTFQPGFPLIDVTFIGTTTTELSINQAPFEVSGPRKCDDSPRAMREMKNAPWWLPVASITMDSRTPSWSTFSSCKGPSYTLEGDQDWIKLNAGQFGLYRVNYPPEIWGRLAAAAAVRPMPNTAPVLSAADMAGLLDDAWALAQAGVTPIVHFLELTRSLAKRQSPEYAPWSVMAGSVIQIYRLLQLYTQDSGCSDRWAAFMRANVTGLFLASNVELHLNTSQLNTSDLQPDVQARLLRPLLLGLAAEFNDSLVTQQALDLFLAANSEALKQDIDIRGTVYSVVVQTGQQADYDAIKELYLAATSPYEKSRTLSALGYATKPELVDAILEFSLSPDVRSQDVASVIQRVAFRGGMSLEKAWQFVRERYVDISEKLGGLDEAADSMGGILRAVASGLAEEGAFQQIDDIFAAHKDVLTEPRFQEGAKEDVRANIDWLHKNGGPVCDWLSQL